jgi:hypothetical protein
MSASSKDGLLALSGSLMGLSTIAVGLRFWARRRYKMRVMADDVFAGLALVGIPTHGLEWHASSNTSSLTKDPEVLAFIHWSIGLCVR